MAHERKKGGQRKDKKVARMREDVEHRHESGHPKPQSDQHDIQSHKPGGPTDKNREGRG